MAFLWSSCTSCLMLLSLIAINLRSILEGEPVVFEPVTLGSQWISVLGLAGAAIWLARRIKHDDQGHS